MPDVASFKSKMPLGRAAMKKHTLAQDVAKLTERLDRLVEALGTGAFIPPPQSTTILPPIYDDYPEDWSTSAKTGETKTPFVHFPVDSDVESETLMFDTASKEMATVFEGSVNDLPSQALSSYPKAAPNGVQFFVESAIKDNPAIYDITRIHDKGDTGVHYGVQWVSPIRALVGSTAANGGFVAAGNEDFDADFGKKDLVIYEMNVRAFTADESSGLDPNIRGSYLGVIEKIPHLLELGVNAVELLPVFEFDEFEFQRRPNPREHLVNTWGYSTINFFSPMSRYASCGGGPLGASYEFKEMVKALHAAGIEVILDVVYNHTNEADDANPYTTSFRGIDNKVYYILELNNNCQLLNFSGCGNTLNCNHPVVMELILDSLRHWTIEYHVDGFRFDLASVLCRGTDGFPLDAPPLIKAIAKDTILSRCKIIAEPWDCGGLYLVGKFPNWDR
ncbi:hypothetical protein GIB67_031455 [Kingdonia uniflora]|uniref:Glycosyl hydrolase family 13 catalytic domain-containing protein n=1 Tax=Kingdonia uniflora TaxID=39325 RepID=A0A7J7MB70_9MAGN|nr:hypothetical protein GIB67_031455 [Kingdonia uniflora]